MYRRKVAQIEYQAAQSDGGALYGGGDGPRPGGPQTRIQIQTTSEHRIDVLVPA